MKKYKVVPERLAFLRGQRVLTQKQLAEQLTIADPSNPVSQIALANWENNRRRVPEKYIAAMMSFFGVSKSYLLGLTDNPDEELDEKVILGLVDRPNIQNSEEKKLEISLDKIYKFHDEPIYVQFVDYVYRSAWGIYDNDTRKIYFKDTFVELNDIKHMNVRLYTVKPVHMYNNNIKNSTLSMVQVMEKKRVYVRMISQDDRINARFDGWYRHTPEGNALVNNIGFVLPYEGLGISFNAFSDGDGNVQV